MLVFSVVLSVSRYFFFLSCSWCFSVVLIDYRHTNHISFYPNSLTTYYTDSPWLSYTRKSCHQICRRCTVIRHHCIQIVCLGFLPICTKNHSHTHTHILIYFRSTFSVTDSVHLSSSASSPFSEPLHSPPCWHLAESWSPLRNPSSSGRRARWTAVPYRSPRKTRDKTMQPQIIPYWHSRYY